jgi:hypothetical protein
MICISFDTLQTSTISYSSSALSSEGTKILVLALSPMPSPLRSPTKTAQTPSRGAIRPFPWKIGDLISDNKVYPFPLQLWVGVFPAMIIILDVILIGQSAVTPVVHYANRA